MANPAQFFTSFVRKDGTFDGLKMMQKFGLETHSFSREAELSKKGIGQDSLGRLSLIHI